MLGTWDRVHGWLKGTKVGWWHVHVLCMRGMKNARNLGMARAMQGGYYNGREELVDTLGMVVFAWRQGRSVNTPCLMQ